MNFSKGQIEAIYEKALMDNEDDIYMNASPDYRDGLLDGMYLLYVALADGARR